MIESAGRIGKKGDNLYWVLHELQWISPARSSPGQERTGGFETGIAWWESDPRILEREHWLGWNAQQLVDEGKLATVRKRMLKWQQALGKPGDPVTQTQYRSALKSLRQAERGARAPDRAKVEAAIADARTLLADSLLPVDRAYLLGTKFTLVHRWTPHPLTLSWSENFISHTREDAGELGLRSSSELTPPHAVRLMIGYGWDLGHASIKVEGNAAQLQQFLKRNSIRGILVKLYPEQLQGPFMQEIPWYRKAAQVRNPLVRVPDPLLAPEQLSHGEVDEMSWQSQERVRALFEELRRRQVQRSGERGIRSNSAGSERALS